MVDGNVIALLVILKNRSTSIQHGEIMKPNRTNEKYNDLLQDANQTEKDIKEAHAHDYEDMDTMLVERERSNRFRTKLKKGRKPLDACMDEIAKVLNK